MRKSRQPPRGSELQARLLFFRAKLSLRHQLAARGFRRKEHLLPALSLFAAFTSDQSKSTSGATLVKTTSLYVSADTAALGQATTKVGIVSLVAAVTCITAGVAYRDASPAATGKPRPVVGRMKNQDVTLLDQLYGPAFRRLASIGKSRDPDGNGFTWTDRAHKGQVKPGANFEELLIDRPALDLRVVIPPLVTSSAPISPVRSSTLRARISLSPAGRVPTRWVKDSVLNLRVYASGIPSN